MESSEAALEPSEAAVIACGGTAHNAASLSFGILQVLLPSSLFMRLSYVRRFEVEGRVDLHTVMFQGGHYEFSSHSYCEQPNMKLLDRS